MKFNFSFLGRFLFFKSLFPCTSEEVHEYWSADYYSEYCYYYYYYYLVTMVRTLSQSFINP